VDSTEKGHVRREGARLREAIEKMEKQNAERIKKEGTAL
jgi:hypothetical protein